MPNPTKKAKCDSCQALMINGVLCHEHGCPDSWKDKLRECLWCGTDFRLEEREQRFCSPDCEQAYRGE